MVPLAPYLLSRLSFASLWLALKRRQQKHTKSSLNFNETGEGGCVSVISQCKLSVPKTVGEPGLQPICTTLGMASHWADRRVSDRITLHGVN